MTTTTTTTTRSPAALALCLLLVQMFQQSASNTVSAFVIIQRITTTRPTLVPSSSSAAAVGYCFQKLKAPPPPPIQRALLQQPSSSSTSTALKCQLLGMNCADPTEFALTWPSFIERGGLTDIHADGWGLAYYQGSSLRQFHDVEAASTSLLAQFLGQQAIQTRNMLAHIRYATAGAVDLANVHPFSREMWGIQWCFCHNGQVPLFEDYPQHLLRGSIMTEDDDDEDNEPHQERIYHPIGTTDSEAAFCAILNALRAKFTDTMPSLPILYEELKVLCDEIVQYKSDETIFNFLLTCGPHLLWVYSWPGKRPGSKVWNGLFYTIRDAGDDLAGANVDGDNYAVSIHAAAVAAAGNNNNNNNGEKQPKVNGNNGSSVEPLLLATKPSATQQQQQQQQQQQVCVVATKPLTNDEEWIELERGELLVLDEGLPRVSVVDLFRAELQGHGLSPKKEGSLSRPRLEEDMRRYRFEPAFFVGGGI